MLVNTAPQVNFLTGRTLLWTVLYGWAIQQGETARHVVRQGIYGDKTLMNGAVRLRRLQLLFAEASACSALSLNYVQVRVWWPPTKDRKKTDFSGMYWPAKVVKHTSEGYEVQYDNGDKEMVLSENVSPFNPPFKFGEEGCALQVGLIPRRSSCLSLHTDR